MQNGTISPMHEIWKFFEPIYIFLNAMKVPFRDFQKVIKYWIYFSRNDLYFNIRLGERILMSTFFDTTLFCKKSAQFLYALHFYIWKTSKFPWNLVTFRQILLNFQTQYWYSKTEVMLLVSLLWIIILKQNISTSWCRSNILKQLRANWNKYPIGM